MVVKNGTFYALYVFSVSNGINAVTLLRSAHFLKQRSSEHLLSVIKRSFPRLSLSVLRRGKGVFVHAIKGYAGVRGKVPLMCSSTLDAVERSALHPGRFTPGTEPRYSLNSRLSWSQSLPGRFWRRENLSPLPGFEAWTAQPVSSLYTVYAILAV